MVSLSNSLQQAIHHRLVGSASMSALVGTGIYDIPPTDAKLPYVTIGDDDIHQEDVTCKNAFRVFFQVDGWSEYGGYKEVKDIAQAAYDALHEYPLAIDGYRVISVNHVKTNYLRERDGILSHSVSDFVAYIEAL